MSSVLVTGASGFVGLPLLAPLVEQGHEVHAVSSRPAPPAIPGVRWHHLDLADSHAVAELLRELRPELLAHLAWYVEHGRVWQAGKNVNWVARSLGLLRAFVAAGGRRAMLLGTCAEYDWKPGTVSWTRSTRHWFRRRSTGPPRTLCGGSRNATPRRSGWRSPGRDCSSCTALVSSRDGSSPR